MTGVYITAAYGCLVLLLEFTGLMSRYIHPHLGRLNLAAALALLLLSLAGAAVARNKGGPSHCSWRERAGYFVLALPLLLFLLFPARELDSTSITAKGIHLMGYDQTEGRNKANRAYKSTLPTGVEAPGEILLQGDGFLDAAELVEKYPGDFIGLPILVEGFTCYPSGASGSLVVARFVLYHCAADIRAVGVVIKLEDLPAPPPDLWVSVEGILSSTERGLVVKAGKISLVDRPARGYIYP